MTRWTDLHFEIVQAQVVVLCTQLDEAQLPCSAPKAAHLVARAGHLFHHGRVVDLLHPVSAIRKCADCWEDTATRGDGGGGTGKRENREGEGEGEGEGERQTHKRVSM